MSVLVEAMKASFMQMHSEQKELRRMIEILETDLAVVKISEETVTQKLNRLSDAVESLVRVGVITHDEANLVYDI